MADSFKILQLIRKHQDNAIVKSLILMDQRLTAHIPKELTELHLDDTEKALFNLNPEIFLPCIVPEPFRRMRKLSSPLLDPASGHAPLKLNEWLEIWYSLLALQVDSNGVAANLLLSEMIPDLCGRSEMNGAFDVLDRLWECRIVWDAFDATDLQILVRGQYDEESQGTPEEVAESTYTLIRTELKHIKENVTTLNDWIEHLYRILPHVKLSLTLFNMIGSKSEEESQHERVVNEVSADIFGTFMKISDCRLLGQHEDCWTRTFLSTKSHTSMDLKSIQRELSYGYRARVQYPKFWFEDALKYSMGDHKEPSTRLNAFSLKQLLSSVVSFDRRNAHLLFGRVT